MKKPLLLAALTILCGTAAFAQQDPQFSHFFFNSIYYNPATAGTKGGAQFAALGRTQWAGYSGVDGGAPQTAVLSFNTPLPTINSGIGAHLVYDQLGPVTNAEFQVSYAYFLKVGQDSKLGIGVRGGVFNRTMNFDKLRALQENDPLLTATGNKSAVAPDLGLGLYYYNDKYFVGASVDHLLEQKYDLGTGTDNYASVRHAYLNAGYNFDVSPDWRITPSILGSMDLESNKPKIDLNGLATYQGRFWGGLSYRTSGAASAVLGLAFLKNNAMRASYAFDLTTSSATKDATAISSHEIYLSYTLPVLAGTPKPVIRTPRYRK